jgi:hypothetical protein
MESQHATQTRNPKLTRTVIEIKHIMESQHATQTRNPKLTRTVMYTVILN